jgi:hypothetical protein
MRAFAPVVLSLVACGDPSGPGECTPPLPAATAAPEFDVGPELGSGAAVVHVGRRVYHDTLFRGFVHARLRTMPVPTQHELVDSEGACRHWFEPGFNCGLGACGQDQICTGENVCSDAPLPGSAGELLVTAGTLAQTLPDSALGLYDAFIDDQPELGCGDATVVASGGAFPAFTLSTPLVPGIEVEGYEALHYRIGDPIAIEWQPEDPTTRVRITLRADRGAHGFMLPSIIECDVPDAAGRVDVPQDMVDRHVEVFSCGECPSASITRYRRVQGLAGALPVELVVEGEHTIFITPGTGPGE